MGQLADRPDAALAARLDPIVDAALAEGRIAGAVVLVGREGQRAYARAAGQADVEAGRPMALDAIFRASSLTKPMVTAAVLSLVDDGVIGLDDPVTRYLPDFQPKWDGQVPTITLRHLLTHTAGLSYGFMQPDDGPYLKLGVSDGMDQPGLGFPEELKRITEAGLVFPPGAAWLYSVGLDVLGAAVEEATGKTLGEVVAERVTRKLGLADTGFTVSDRARLAKAYADGPPPKPMGATHTVPFAELSGIKFAPDRIFDPGSFPSGGAGMACSAPDFHTFLEAILHGGGPIVSAETARDMMTNQTGGHAIVTSGPGWGFGFGGAVMLDPSAQGSPLPAGAWMWGGVYGHSWFADPASKTSFVLMTNTSTEGMSGRLSQELMAAVAA
ncbi:MAG: beta-lactamase family protein [Alphaproteobacteria bacterium]|nr:beta-lactamase family protein [Alphaproteobacteria bacterium]MBU1512732.1 beta-lactamase family protein [Alphaproteobacteria bacterium]MBU2096111.1 beta-lactamase family protein [Alphaproteobacteria bacterium]MBU2152467.1 beta-lactamase family protein [Alphaproteobacteria bacterium]MBU2307999.1 beta-lactamase family protein [Alphaproteobacteria bacterium]